MCGASRRESAATRERVTVAQQVGKVAESSKTLPIVWALRGCPSAKGSRDVLSGVELQKLHGQHGFDVPNEILVRQFFAEQLDARERDRDAQILPVVLALE